MNKFVIDIPNEKAGTYRLINFIILLLHFFVFGAVFLRAASSSMNYASVAGLVINGIPAIYFMLNKKHLRSPLIQVSFLFDAVLWFIMGSIPIALLVIVLTLLSFVANKKLQIIFDEEGIIYPSFPVKKYSWREVEQVILKDGILTIDLKNNKLIQVNLDKHSGAGFDSIQLNEFASANTDTNKNNG